MAEPNGNIICVVDDDPSVLKAVVRLLSMAGRQVKEFSDPEEFLLYVKTHGAAVAVLDVWMPQVTGLDVQSRLRDVSPSTRVIMFTAINDSDVRSAALRAGASAFLMKPLDGEQLLGAIDSALTSKE
jgi:two-component system response regulator HydG